MRYLRRTIYILLLVAAADPIPLWMLLGQPLTGAPFTMWWWLPFLAALLFINLFPLPATAPTRPIRQLAAGCELRWLFLASKSSPSGRVQPDMALKTPAVLPFTRKWVSSAP